MKLKNKCDLFVRFCHWPGLLEDCSSRPWIACGIVNRGSIVSGTRREKVRKQIEKQSVMMTFFVNNALLQLDFRLVRVS